MKKLRASYFSNETSIQAIRNSNVALMSDLALTDSILKAVVVQTEVGFNSPESSQKKNIFLFRFGRLAIDFFHFIIDIREGKTDYFSPPVHLEFVHKQRKCAIAAI